MTSVFVDSNVIVYSLDRTSPNKRATAKAWLKRLTASRATTLSVQVVNEAYAVLTLRRGLDPVSDRVRRSLTPFLRLATAPLDVAVVVSAWRLQDRFQVRTWDALLLASANAAGCSHFLSEDLNDGQVYGGVVVVNPFRHAPEEVLGRALR